jgi:hypothetical protein
MRSEVDLPQPGGADETRNSPSAMSMLSLSTEGHPRVVAGVDPGGVHLHLDRPAPGGHCHPRGLLRRHGRDDRVHLDPVAYRLRPHPVRLFEGGGEPPGIRGDVVVVERRELTPAV